MARIAICFLLFCLIKTCIKEVNRVPLIEGRLELADSIFVESVYLVEFLNYDKENNRLILRESSSQNTRLLSHALESGELTEILSFSDIPSLTGKSLITANIFEDRVILLTTSGLLFSDSVGQHSIFKGLIAQNLPTNTFLQRIVAPSDILYLMAHYPYVPASVPKVVGVASEGHETFYGSLNLPAINLPIDGHILLDFDESNRVLNFVFNPFQIGFSADLSKLRSGDLELNVGSYLEVKLDLEFFRHPSISGENYSINDFGKISQIYDLFCQDGFNIVHYTVKEVAGKETIYHRYISLYDSDWTKLCADMKLPDIYRKIHAKIGQDTFLVETLVEYSDKTRFDIVRIIL